MNDSTGVDCLHPLAHWIPTPAEILAACTRIRSTWTPEERLRRQVGRYSGVDTDENIGVDEADLDDASPFRLHQAKASAPELGELNDSDYFDDADIIAGELSSVG